jgi:hypothetical protein
VRIHGSGAQRRRERALRAWDELPGDLRALLDEPELRAVAAAYGPALGRSVTPGCPAGA